VTAASGSTEAGGAAASAVAEVTVIMVSYNTRELTLRAIETLRANAGDVTFHLVVWDNASHDGSADAIAEAYPDVELVRSAENIGFARANNRVAESADTEWLLLLNPDTETYPNAVEHLLRFAQANPGAGIVGGRTVFPDGTLNPSSCCNTMTVWSLFCSAVGLTFFFPESRLFNREGIGGWRRDSVRRVDVVVGCFLLISTRLWRELGGFRPEYVMYGEEHDLCLRAARLGYRPMITPEAQIMHIVGASTSHRPAKTVAVQRARATIIRQHWPRQRTRLGLALLWLWGALRYSAATVVKFATGRGEATRNWGEVWSRRSEWLAGY
jgi:GT2 family glycosyltransferase